MNAVFFINSILLGFGLAMDAFSVSLANGFCEPHMKGSRMAFIAGIYAVFQFVMPVSGWFLVHNAANAFAVVQQFTPWIALVLLCIIGGKMFIEGFRSRKCRGDGDCANCTIRDCERYGFAVGQTIAVPVLMVQGVATSIDALSVGFTIADYTTRLALVCSLVIGVETFAICLSGLKLGTHFGTKLEGKAKMVGGWILIFIGLEIFFG